MIMKSIKVYWSNDQKGNYIKFHGGVRTDMRIFPSLFKFLEKKIKCTQLFDLKNKYIACKHSLSNATERLKC